jgi:hypothetical protein
MDILFGPCNYILRCFQRHIIFLFIFLSEVRLSPLGTAVITGLLYQSQLIDDGDRAETVRMKIGRGNWSTRRKPAPMPLCPSQIPYDLPRARTRAATVGSQRLTAWAMPRPWRHVLADSFLFSTKWGSNGWRAGQFRSWMKSLALGCWRKSLQWPVIRVTIAIAWQTTGITATAQVSCGFLLTKKPVARYYRLILCMHVPIVNKYDSGADWTFR